MIFREHPFLEPQDQIDWLRKLLDKGDLGTALHLRISPEIKSCFVHPCFRSLMGVSTLTKWEVILGHRHRSAACRSLIVEGV